MPQDDGPYFFRGEDDAKKYYLRGTKGERQSYSKAYADTRLSRYYDDKNYMRDVGRGGTVYDQARMSDAADAASSSYNRKSKRSSAKRSSKRY